MTTKARPPKQLAAASVGAFVLTSVAFASACPIRLTPPDAAEAWQAAARDAGRRLATSPASPGDCKAVDLAVQADGGARLTFTTTDGRSAVRALQSPDDVAPALEALLVTLPPEPAPPPRAPAKAPPPSTPTPPPPTPHFLLAASGGGRIAPGVALVAPAALLRASGMLGRWELGAQTEWNPTYARYRGNTPAGFAMSSFEGNVLLGRREPTRHFEAAYGLSVGISTMREEADATSTATSALSVETVEPRIGGYLRAALPQDSSVRLTIGLDMDIVLSRSRKGDSSDTELIALPRFGLGLALGVETVAL